jgi:hypothetical protein
LLQWSKPPALIEANQGFGTHTLSFSEISFQKRFQLPDSLCWLEDVQYGIGQAGLKMGCGSVILYQLQDVRCSIKHKHEPLMPLTFSQPISVATDPGIFLAEITPC